MTRSVALWSAASVAALATLGSLAEPARMAGADRQDRSAPLPSWHSPGLPGGARGAEAVAKGRHDPRRAPALSWSPDPPAQGRLFRLHLSGVPADARRVEGEAAGETLHFEPVGEGVFTSLAPASVDAEAIEVSVRIHLPGNRQESVEARIPVASGAYQHERLTVAPEFGSPLDSARQARLARDQERARAVSRQAHRTPRLFGGSVVLPRNSRVTSSFGNGREFNGQISSRHMGLDLAGRPGDTVFAAARGVVALVDEFLLAGNIVYVNHGAGLLSGYFHLSEQLVAEGDTVEAGTPIGRVGATGRVTGPHLHWVVRYGATSVDPRSLLDVAGTASAGPEPAGAAGNEAAGGAP